MLLYKNMSQADFMSQEDFMSQADFVVKKWFQING